MGYLLFDASAISKRYSEEAGKEAVDAVFQHALAHELITTPWGYLETYAVLLRRTNNRQLSQKDFIKATGLMEAEILNSAFRLLTIDDGTVISSTAIVAAHNLNATDSALLATFLRFAQAVGLSSCLLIASDKRLLRAAIAEGLPCLNPETVSVADVPTLLATL